MVTRWFVSRQDYWGEENPLAVEIAAGGLNYANADMLCVAYARLGEGEEYEDPREAAALLAEVVATQEEIGASENLDFARQVHRAATQLAGALRAKPAC